MPPAAAFGGGPPLRPPPPPPPPPPPLPRSRSRSRRCPRRRHRRPTTCSRTTAPTPRPSRWSPTPRRLSSATGSSRCAPRYVAPGPVTPARRDPPAAPECLGRPTWLCPRPHWDARHLRPRPRPPAGNVRENPWLEPARRRVRLLQPERPQPWVHQWHFERACESSSRAAALGTECLPACCLLPAGCLRPPAAFACLLPAACCLRQPICLRRPCAVLTPRAPRRTACCPQIQKISGVECIGEQCLNGSR